MRGHFDNYATYKIVQKFTICVIFVNRLSDFKYDKGHMYKKTKVILYVRKLNY